MNKRKPLAYLLAALLLLQVFCVPVFAALDPDVAITYDMDARTVNVKVTGLEANSMISLTGFYDDATDYLNQYQADGDGALDVTYPSSAVWAAGGVIKVRIGGAGFDSPVTQSVTITSDKPFISEYTNNLTVGYAANIKVIVGNAAPSLSAEVTVGGNVYKASFSDGSALINVPVRINQDDALVLRLMDGDTLIDSENITMNPAPATIWAVNPEMSGNDLRVIFGAAITAGPKGYAATINGNDVVPVQDGDNILKFENATLLEENTIVISGVKFPLYFPSYSFTFTVAYSK